MHVAFCCKVAAALKFTFKAGNREQWQDVTLGVTDLIRVFPEIPLKEFHLSLIGQSCPVAIQNDRVCGGWRLFWFSDQSCRPLEMNTWVLLAGETVEEIVCQPVGPGRGCDELDLGSQAFNLFRVERKGNRPTKGEVWYPGCQPTVLRGGSVVFFLTMLFHAYCFKKYSSVT